MASRPATFAIAGVPERLVARRRRRGESGSFASPNARWTSLGGLVERRATSAPRSPRLSHDSIAGGAMKSREATVSPGAHLPVELAPDTDHLRRAAS